MDEGNLRRVLAREFQADLEAVDSAEEALTALASRQYDLVLINRVFDQNGEEGLELIQKIKSEPATQSTPVMLISNYPDFQSQAEKLGAAPGIGKSTLSTKESLQRLAAFLAPATGATS